MAEDGSAGGASSMSETVNHGHGRHRTGSSHLDKTLGRVRHGHLAKHRGRASVLDYVSNKNTNAVTRLENLYNSQYVGSVGVGTISQPKRCYNSAANNMAGLKDKRSSSIGGIGGGLGLAEVGRGIFGGGAGDGADKKPLAFVARDFAADLRAKGVCHFEEESTINVVFDTGSTNLWISSDLCKTEPCITAVSLLLCYRLND